ncbi:MAG: putative oxidoreductase YjmC [Deltaproteobacteria bacterium ADurb.Bin510]|nr:MAG: putative oxidoreductase YjmC [Deltaproteobacteria bacterium ADurb.Bin510]
MIEILCASFGGSAFGKALNGFDADGKAIPYALGHFFMAINPEGFSGLETFKRTTGAIMREIRSSKVAPGEQRIYLAGEKEFEMIERRKAEGIPVNEALQDDIRKHIKEYDIKGFDFSFL